MSVAEVLRAVQRVIEQHLQAEPGFAHWKDFYAKPVEVSEAPTPKPPMEGLCARGACVDALVELGVLCLSEGSQPLF